MTESEREATTLDESKLLKLMALNEGPKLDFKLYYDLNNESTKKELTKDVIAMANTHGGRGHIVIGVEDKSKRIFGVDPEDYPEEKIQQILLNRCDPPIPVRVEDFIIDNKLLIVITVFRSHNKPHQMRQTGAFYIRRGSTTDYARRNELALMYQHNSLLYDELIPVRHARIAQLDHQLINNFLAKTTAEVYREGREIILSDLGIAYYDNDDNTYYPTVGGLLLFANQPQLFLPHTAVNIYCVEGSGAKTHRIIKGNIIEMLNQSLAYIERLIARDHYPMRAVEEALGNALVHRDYFDVGREINVVITAQQIEIINPGQLYEPLKIDHLLSSRISHRRNNWMYHQLIILDELKRFNRFGRGMQKIMQFVSDVGRAQFINLPKQNVFKVILPRRPN